MMIQIQLRRSLENPLWLVVHESAGEYPIATVDDNRNV